jgi:hypothetical protein
MNTSDSIVLAAYQLKARSVPEKVIKHSGDFTQLSIQQLGATKIIKENQLPSREIMQSFGCESLGGD